MNIFKVLSSGHGNVSETNMSAFLAYLLDPSEGHGLGSAFLEKFLEPIVLANMDDLKELYSEKKKGIRSLSVKSKFFDVDVALEQDIGTKRLDILISLYRKSVKSDGGELICVFGVENKIKKESIVRGQLIGEVDGLRKKSEGTPCALLFLTRQGSGESEYEELKEQAGDVKTEYMVWEEDEKNPSVFQMLSDVLKSSYNGEDEALYGYVRHTIISCMNFIKDDFVSYREEEEAAIERGTRISWLDVENDGNNLNPAILNKYKKQLDQAKRFYDGPWYRVFVNIGEKKEIFVGEYSLGSTNALLYWKGEKVAKIIMYAEGFHIHMLHRAAAGKSSGFDGFVEPKEGGAYDSRHQEYRRQIGYKEKPKEEDIEYFRKALRQSVEYLKD